MCSNAKRKCHYDSESEHKMDCGLNIELGSQRLQVQTPEESCDHQRISKLCWKDDKKEQP